MWNVPSLIFVSDSYTCHVMLEEVGVFITEIQGVKEEGM